MSVLSKLLLARHVNTFYDGFPESTSATAV